MTDQRTPAFSALLGLTPHVDLPEDACPSECPGCPFGTRLDVLDAGDLAVDAYYRCDLLDKRVWGDEPQCLLRDWQARARKEIGHDAA